MIKSDNGNVILHSDEEETPRILADYTMDLTYIFRAIEEATSTEMVLRMISLSIEGLKRIKE